MNHDMTVFLLSKNRRLKKSLVRFPTSVCARAALSWNSQAVPAGAAFLQPRGNARALAF